jgi:hypothetical protein
MRKRGKEGHFDFAQCPEGRREGEKFIYFYKLI